MLPQNQDMSDAIELNDHGSYKSSSSSTYLTAKTSLQSNLDERTSSNTISSKPYILTHEASNEHSFGNHVGTDTSSEMRFFSIPFTTLLCFVVVILVSTVLILTLLLIVSWSTSKKDDQD